MKLTQDTYLQLLAAVAKHLQTLIKYLRDSIAKSEDPVAIELN